MVEDFEPESRPYKKKTALDVAGYARGREAGRKEGFAEGVRYTVTLAEENLMRYLKLSTRDKVVDKLPGWWVLTLVTALRIDQLPANTIIRSKEHEQESSVATTED